MSEDPVSHAAGDSVEHRLWEALTQAGFPSRGGPASLGIQPFLGFRAARRYGLISARSTPAGPV
jgi:hypothetical protein